MTLSIPAQTLSVIMMNITFFYGEYHYAERRYTECRYAERALLLSIYFPIYSSDHQCCGSSLQHLRSGVKVIKRFCP